MYINLLTIFPYTNFKFAWLFQLSNLDLIVGIIRVALLLEIFV